MGRTTRRYLTPLSKLIEAPPSWATMIQRGLVGSIQMSWLSPPAAVAVRSKVDPPSLETLQDTEAK